MAALIHSQVSSSFPHLSFFLYLFSFSVPGIDWQAHHLILAAFAHFVLFCVTHFCLTMASAQTTDVNIGQAHCLPLRATGSGFFFCLEITKVGSLQSVLQNANLNLLLYSKLTW
jgi:hypothetical protein